VCQRKGFLKHNVMGSSRILGYGVGKVRRGTTWGGRGSRCGSCENDMGDGEFGSWCLVGVGQLIRLVGRVSGPVKGSTVAETGIFQQRTTNKQTQQQQQQ